MLNLYFFLIHTLFLFVFKSIKKLGIDKTFLKSQIVTSRFQTHLDLIADSKTVGISACSIMDAARNVPTNLFLYIFLL